jgi:hypothetical protein
MNRHYRENIPLTRAGGARYIKPMLNVMRNFAGERERRVARNSPARVCGGGERRVAGGVSLNRAVEAKRLRG